MTERKIWFHAVWSRDSIHQPGAVPRGRISFHPVALQGSLTIGLFLLALVGGLLGIWVGAFTFGWLSLPNAIALSIMLVPSAIVIFIRVVRAHTITPPPRA
jgi:hypothetical protein